MSREAEIKITVMLDDENSPLEMFWEATQAAEPGKKRCEAFMLSMWDKDAGNSLTIDLWTNKMEVSEMNTHYFFTLMKLADTYEKATANNELAQKIRDFATDFADSAGELDK